MANTKKKKKDEKETEEYRETAYNVVRQNLNTEHGNFSGGTRGSPGRPKYTAAATTSGGMIEAIADNTIVERIVEDIEETKRRGGVVCILAYVLNNHNILWALKDADVVAVVQKDVFNIPMLEKYIDLRCGFRRGDFPGKIIPHLYRRDGQDDFGLMEALRLLGNEYPTPRMRKNENRPLAHDKVFAMLYPDDKNKLIPAVSYSGSNNPTENSPCSFDNCIRATDSNFTNFYYDMFAHAYSKSEGLYNISWGIEPTYDHSPKVMKYSSMPKCPNCGGKKLVPIWISAGDDDCFGAHRHLKCTACGNDALIFLKENQPVT